MSAEKYRPLSGSFSSISEMVAVRVSSLRLPAADSFLLPEGLAIFIVRSPRQMRFALSTKYPISAFGWRPNTSGLLLVGRPCERTIHNCRTGSIGTIIQRSVGEAVNCRAFTLHNPQEASVWLAVLVSRASASASKLRPVGTCIRTLMNSI